MVPCCYQSQNYKIWKQFTTGNADEWTLLLLLLITKLQNLKAIHNSLTSIMRWRTVVINHKTTKFESNSQHKRLPVLLSLGCYQSQNYKIWKQFTTNLDNVHARFRLLSIAKLQNLKAIHNYTCVVFRNHQVVINHKTTKFESNSQLYIGCGHWLSGCYQSQNYKIWKQFTTTHTQSSLANMLLSITKLQNLKAIHNVRASFVPS